MPFCHARLKRQWRPAGYPCVLRHLGDHIRKRRIDLGLQLKEAANLLGAHPTSVANWEKGKRAPAVVQWPKILEFLEYDPRPKEESVGERLKRHREGHGWSQPEAAARLGVSSSVLWRWEIGQRQPKGKYLAKVYWFLGDDPRPAPETIGERLKRHRERLPLPMRAMATALGVAESTLCRWETGYRAPTGENLMRVEAMLNSSSDVPPP